MKYVNPPKRVKMFEHLKDNMTKIFTERMNLVKKLQSLEPDSITKNMIQ